LIIFGASIAFLSLMGTNMVPQSLRSLGVFAGVFNTVVLLISGCIVVVATFCLFWRRISAALQRLPAFLKKWMGNLNSISPTEKRVPVCCSMLVCLGLIVLALYGFASHSDVFEFQQKFIEGEWTNSYVFTGTQFVLGVSGEILLLIASSIAAGVGLIAVKRFYVEIKEGMFTSSLIQLLCICALILVIMFPLFNCGLFSALELIQNQLLWFLALVVCLVTAVSLLILHPITLMPVSEIRRKLVSAGNVANTILTILLVMTLAFMVLANTVLPEEGKAWLNDSIVGILLSTVCLAIIAYVGRKSLLSNNLVCAVKEKGITRLHLGIFGGVIGVFLAGVLMWVVTLQTQSVVGSALIICGALGGLGFGAFTRGSRKIRGIIGCVFGIIAIVFGLVMTYTTPIIIGYSLDGAPLYKWHDASFGAFLINQIVSLQGIFYLLLGLLIATLAAAYLSYGSGREKQGSRQSQATA
jgi:hypothetical protein